MLAEILTIGDELCRGEIVDTNSSWLAAELWQLGVTTRWLTSCGDDPADMRRALADAAGRAELVLTSGGLGPTEDDLTVDVVAACAGAEPAIHEPSRARMEARFAAASFRPSAAGNWLRQVRAPAGARVYDNPAGLAPGFEVAFGGVPIICMPGIPRELHAIFQAHVVARVVELREAAGERVERIARKVFRVFGRGESQIAGLLEGLLGGAAGAGASLHYNVSFPETLVKIVVRDRVQAAAEARLADLEVDLRRRLGALIYGEGDDSQAAVIGRALAARGLRLATAESCTGGLVGGLVTAVAGSSRYFVGGAVTYADGEKIRQLGVAPATLADHGAVSEPCVIEMARGVRTATGAELGVAVSGIAGPDGGTAAKPVGTVWLAVAGPGDALVTKHLVWPGPRDQVRLLAAHWALALVRGALAAA